MLETRQAFHYSRWKTGISLEKVDRSTKFEFCKRSNPNHGIKAIPSKEDGHKRVLCLEDKAETATILHIWRNRIYCYYKI